jgi:hypothetical protein
LGSFSTNFESLDILDWRSAIASFSNWPVYPGSDALDGSAEPGCAATLAGATSETGNAIASAIVISFS